MKKAIAFLIPMLAVMPASLAAQSANADADARAEGRARVRAPDPGARIQSALDVAMEAGIPASLLESKVAEGHAKGVPMDRIAVAVENRLDALVQAKGVLDGAGVEAVSAGELAVTADALSAGVAANTVARIAREAPRERRAVATAVLTDLVRLGHASETALARVNAALSAGPAALASLRAEAAASLGARGRIGVGIPVGGH